MDSYMQRGGLSWGMDLFLNSIRVTYPFAEIGVFPDKIVFKVDVLRIYKKEIILEKTDIVKIELKRYLYSKGCLFSHTNMYVEKILIFWSFSPKKLMENLTKMGYGNVIQPK